MEEVFTTFKTEIDERVVSQLMPITAIVKNNLFKIPDYQRGYSWEEKQLEDLLKDILHIADKDHMHYTGTLVYTHNGTERKDIVDGQQRITTLIILLKAIYDTNPEKYASIKEQFIEREDGIYVLETNEDTKRFFRTAILNDKNSDCNIKSERNLKAAKKYFTEWFDAHSDQTEKVYQSVVNKLGFICFSPKNTDEIGIMFEVINNRGKGLSELEKIKNYFIYYSTIKSRNSLRGQINDTWGKILEHLSKANVTSNSDENNFLRNCYIVYFSTNKSKSWNVYGELKKRYKPDDSNNVDRNIEEISSFIDFIEQAAKHFMYFKMSGEFRNIYKGDNRDEIDLVLKRLRCHPVNASILPLYLSIMSYLEETPRAQGAPDKVARLLKILEIVNFRTYVLPNTRIARADSRQGDLFEWAFNLYWKPSWNSANFQEIHRTWKGREIHGDIFTWVEMNLEDFIESVCPEKVFVQSLTVDRDEAIDYYDWNGLRFFMASYEEYLNRNRRESWPIEKILKTRSEVQSELANDYLSKEHIWARENRPEEFPRDIREKRRLGNFVLLGMTSNIQLSNNEIGNKVDYLIKNSSISMCHVDHLRGYYKKAVEVAESFRKRRTKYFYYDIALSLIDQRENDLIKFALDRWKMPNENFGKFIKVDSFQANSEGKNEYFYLKENKIN